MIGCAEKAYADKNKTNYAYVSDILKGATLGTKGVKGTKGALGTKGAAGAKV